ncbi:transposase [Lutibacter sp.]|uniref:transposase n=1 Tax=Lutibacter sp. TaxID=1925666 RepID=UPI00345713DC
MKRLKKIALNLLGSPLRLVSFYHKEKNKAYYFRTNLFDLPAAQIAMLYKKRWEIELLFKKIKQNFPLQYFYGDNKNAIQIQIWCTLIALLLNYHYEEAIN